MIQPGVLSRPLHLDCTRFFMFLLACTPRSLPLVSLSSSARRFSADEGVLCPSWFWNFKTQETVDTRCPVLYWMLRKKEWSLLDGFWFCVLDIQARQVFLDMRRNKSMNDDRSFCTLPSRSWRRKRVNRTTGARRWRWFILTSICFYFISFHLIRRKIRKSSIHASFHANPPFQSIPAWFAQPQLPFYLLIFAATFQFSPFLSQIQLNEDDGAEVNPTTMCAPPASHEFNSLIDEKFCASNQKRGKC